MKVWIVGGGGGARGGLEFSSNAQELTMQYLQTLILFCSTNQSFKQPNYKSH